MGIDGIRDYLTTGKGRIIVRAEVRLEETPRSRSLVVTQIPPIGRDKVKASIVKAINSRKLEGLLPDLRDESDTEKGLRIVLELRKDASAAQALSQLFNETDLQVALSFQMVFLFGEPMQAARQPAPSMTNCTQGNRVMEPTPTPAKAMPIAIPRRRTNQLGRNSDWPE